MDSSGSEVKRNHVVNMRPRVRPKIVSLGSGKGGVGKTLSTVNLAISLRRMGYSVLILDADMGLANVDVVLGLKGRFNLLDVIDGAVELKDIILKGPMGVDVIPSGSGLSRLTQLTQLERLQLLEQIGKFEIEYQFVLIDTGAGISDTVLHFNSVADEIIVVTTPEPHAMTDAYAFIKVMSEQYDEKHYGLIVNMSKSEEEGLKVSQRIADVAAKFLSANIKVLGIVPFDPQLQKSVMLRRAASEQSTYTLAGQSWNRIAQQHFGTYSNQEKNRRSDGDFWRDLVLQATGNRARVFG